MVSQPDVALAADTWVNITAAISASAGNDLLVQNIGETPIRVENSVGAPSAENVGFRVSPKKFLTATTGGSENVWVRALGSPSTAHAQVV